MKATAQANNPILTGIWPTGLRCAKGSVCVMSDQKSGSKMAVGPAGIEKNEV
ncbi:MAG: hypothetical protein Q8Q26_19570 [Pseudorhodobacter sp.]|nr:hypothetical protein [Pseudorhodobacter sp.]